MNDLELQLEGKIGEVKGKLKQKYGMLTDDDLVYQKGREEEFFGRLERKIGKSRTEIRQEISNLLNF
ncbi:MAG: CsbD family protein [Cytophagales bacterium]|nr:CsbD family protein [Cytophagales bacterium]